jgi:hypothetical protein
MAVAWPGIAWLRHMQADGPLMDLVHCAAVTECGQGRLPCMLRCIDRSISPRACAREANLCCCESLCAVFLARAVLDADKSSGLDGQGHRKACWSGGHQTSTGATGQASCSCPSPSALLRTRRAVLVQGRADVIDCHTAVRPSRAWHLPGGVREQGTWDMLRSLRSLRNQTSPARRASNLYVCLLRTALPQRAIKDLSAASR